MCCNGIVITTAALTFHCIKVVSFGYISVLYMSVKVEKCAPRSELAVISDIRAYKHTDICTYGRVDGHGDGLTDKVICSGRFAPKKCNICNSELKIP